MKKKNNLLLSFIILLCLLEDAQGQFSPRSKVHFQRRTRAEQQQRKQPNDVVVNQVSSEELPPGEYEMLAIIDNAQDRSDKSQEDELLITDSSSRVQYVRPPGSIYEQDTALLVYNQDRIDPGDWFKGVYPLFPPGTKPFAKRPRRQRPPPGYPFRRPNYTKPPFVVPPKHHKPYQLVPQEPPKPFSFPTSKPHHLHPVTPQYQPPPPPSYDDHLPYQLHPEPEYHHEEPVHQPTTPKTYVQHFGHLPSKPDHQEPFRPYTPTPRPYSHAPRQYGYATTPKPYVPTPEPYAPTPKPHSPTPKPVKAYGYATTSKPYAPTPKPYSPTPKPYAPTPKPPKAYTPTPAPYRPPPPTPYTAKPKPPPKPYTPAPPKPYSPTPHPYTPSHYAPTPKPYSPTPKPYSPAPKPYEHEEPSYHHPTSPQPPHGYFAPTPKPHHHVPEPEYVKPVEAYKPPKIDYHPPTPTAYKPTTPKPLYHIPDYLKPLYEEVHEPIPKHHKPAPTPGYHQPPLKPVHHQPEYQEPPPKPVYEEPEYYQPKEQYHTPEYHAPTPKYHEPTPKPVYYQPEYHEPTPKTYGYATTQKPYSPTPKPVYHEPEHHAPPPKPVHHEPEYHEPKYQAPTPKPVHHEPEYHEPEYNEPEYHEPTPKYHEPTPAPYQPTPKPYQPTPKPYQPTPKPYKPEPTTPEPYDHYEPPYQPYKPEPEPEPYQPYKPEPEPKPYSPPEPKPYIPYELHPEPGYPKESKYAHFPVVSDVPAYGAPSRPDYRLPKKQNLYNDPYQEFSEDPSAPVRIPEKRKVAKASTKGNVPNFVTSKPEKPARINTKSRQPLDALDQLKAIAGVKNGVDGNLVKTEKPFICPSDGHYGDPNDCTKFYKCAHGTPVIEYCPATLFWNQDKQQCDWPENSLCNFDPESVQAKTISQKTYMYLTFDDGPNEGTDNVLDALRDYGVKATFFINSDNMYDPKTAKAEASQKALLKVVDDGHILADHSFDHMSHNSHDSPRNAYMNVEQDMQYFGNMNSEPVLDLLWSNGRRDVMNYVNFTLNSLVRMPYTNNWRVPYLRITADCSGCTIPASSGQRGIDITNRLAREGKRVFGWDDEWGVEWKHNTLKYGGAAMYQRLNRRHTKSPQKVVLLMHDIAYRSPKDRDELRTFVRLAKDSGYIFSTLDQYESDTL